jgi:hypothetical protein
MDFDWADELIHTYYGKRWVEEFLKQSDTAKTLRDVKESAREAVFRKIAQATPEEKAATSLNFQRMMQKMAAQAGKSPVDEDLASNRNRPVAPADKRLP